MQQSSIPITTEEYILREWFRMVKEEEDGEEVLYSGKMVVICIDYESCYDFHIKLN